MNDSPIETETGIERRPEKRTTHSVGQRARLSRRRLLHLTTLGLAGIVGASSSASARAPTRTITIEGRGSPTSYRLTVSEGLEKSTANGATIQSNDTISGSSAAGRVVGGNDSYAFSGEVVALALDGDATVTVDGRPIDPAQYPSDVLTVEGVAGTGSRYEFTVDGPVTKTTAHGATVQPNDTVSSDGDVSGRVFGAGRDSFAFEGRLERFKRFGGLTLYLNGRPIDPDKYPTDILTVEGTGSETHYEFAVDGDLRKSTAFGATRNGNDTVSNATATGVVGGGRDSFAFSGQILRFDSDGNLNLYLNGGEIDPSQYPEKVLTVAANGSGTTYEFAVTGTLEKSTANGASINGNDDISADGSTATGRVAGSGRDSYAFDGVLRSLEVNGNATVLVNDREIDPDLSPILGIYSGLSESDFDTIGRMEEWQGTPFAVQNLFVPWNPNSGHMDWLFDRVLPRIWDHGRVPLITWEPFTPAVQSASVDEETLVENGGYDAYLQGLADTTPDDIEVRIKNGEYDSYIDTWADRLKGWLAGPDGKLGTGDDRRAYIRLGHEMNGNWYPWAPARGGESPSDYIGMWRRVHRRFDRKNIGGQNIQWMWCANADDVGAYSAEQLYPGDEYVDWVAFTGYNWGESASWSRWESPHSVYGNMLERLRALTDKPLCIAEVGSTSETSSGHDPQQKDQWIRDVFAYFDARGVEMWCWFNEDKETDWAVFDGVRGTETVSHNGTDVNAYRQYREAVGTYTVTTTDIREMEPLAAVRFAGGR